MERRLASCPVRGQPRRPCLRLMSTDLADPGNERNASHDQQQDLPTFDRACLRVQAGAEDSYSRHPTRTTSNRAVSPSSPSAAHTKGMGPSTPAAPNSHSGLAFAIAWKRQPTRAPDATRDLGRRRCREARVFTSAFPGAAVSAWAAVRVRNRSRRVREREWWGAILALPPNCAAPRNKPFNGAVEPFDWPHLTSQGLP